MLSSLETPRPRPPAKVRKANAMQQKMSSSPPPAYGSPFTFPARRQMRQDILGSPMATTFQMVGWDQTNDVPTNESETASDELAWMNEKSREELKDLLLKADVLIKQRENELGLTSAVCKGLYQNNVALKTKHQALLARIPTSPPRSTSSPGNLYTSSLSYDDGASITTSYSESAVGLIRSPSPALYKRHARRVSIAADDVSLLADQNAELLDKLEKLEEEATAADHAGRRELKRLEKEIAFLRDALETTQARSDELEEKVQVTVASEAWRRKKEREAKFRAMRNLGRDSSGSDSTDEDSKVQNFAPEGSTFGGPSETFSFFPTAESPDPNRHRLPNISEDSDILTSVTSFDVDVKGSSLRPHEHALISQLLIKVQELEETNAKILQQQSDTATQLSAMQRDTAHISRVYECLSDHNAVELELAQRGWDEDEENDNVEDGDEGSGGAIHFKSLKRSLASELGSLQGTCIVRPEFTSSGKNRKTVMGLFDAGQATQDEQEDHPSNGTHENDPSSLSVTSSPWSEGHDNSSWSSGIAGIGGTASPLSRLSPLHFFSPPSQTITELSPLDGRDTLQSELDRELSRSWNEMQDRNDQFHHNHHLRTSSLYDLGQISVPPSPSPTSRVFARRASDELDFDDVRAALNKPKDSNATTTNETTPRSSALLMPANSLQLSVEPPTPEARRLYQLRTADHDDNLNISPAKSPRVQLISEALRSRSHRWVDRRFRRRSKERSVEREWNKNNFDTFVDGSEGIEPTSGGASAKTLTVAVLGSEVAAASIAALVIPKRLMSAVDNMIDGFETVTHGVCEGASSDPTNSYDDLVDGAGDSDPEEVFYSPPITPRVHIRRRIIGNKDRESSPVVKSRHDRDSEVGEEPNARPRAHGETTGPTDTQLLSLTSPRKSDADYAQQSFLLKFWLWVQFAIVVFVFLYAMARRGPTIILSDESKNKRAVTRRR